MTHPAEIERIFYDAPLIRELGLELVTYGEGRCETRMDLRDMHQQQDGLVHAGVQATIADHTAGMAAATLIDADQMVLTVEFKINLLRAARGQRLLCKASVLKPGRRLSVVESEVYCEESATQKLVSKASLTIAVLDKSFVST